jgi:hypothetical protein
VETPAALAVLVHAHARRVPALYVVCGLSLVDLGADHIQK